MYECHNGISQDLPGDAWEQAMERWKTKTVSHFSTRGCDDLYESVQEICCTWNLNTPCLAFALAVAFAVAIADKRWIVTNRYSNR
jgi:hypothetical protein